MLIKFWVKNTLLKLASDADKHFRRKCLMRKHSFEFRLKKKAFKNLCNLGSSKLWTPKTEISTKVDCFLSWLLTNFVTSNLMKQKQLIKNNREIIADSFEKFNAGHKKQSYMFYYFIIWKPDYWFPVLKFITLRIFTILFNLAESRNLISYSRFMFRSAMKKKALKWKKL